jgi:glycosyltransferase involved in cell wall biosynthesis
MSAKRILIFSTAYYPFVGGAEVAIRAITDRMRGFECDVVTAKFDKHLPRIERIGNVTVHRIGFGHPVVDKIILPFWGALYALRLNAAKEYMCFWGIMASWGSGAGFVANIVRRFFGKKKIPMILTLQEGDSDSHLTYRWGGLIALSWWLALRNADVLTGISNFLLHRAKRLGYAGKSVLVPNGVHVKIFTRKVTLREKEEIRQKLGKKKGDVFLVTTSRLSKKNALDDVINALPLLPEYVHFVVIGKGEEGRKLVELADKLHVMHRVRFLGFIPQEEIPSYFSVSDIFIRPSRSEGFGNSFIEAMAARLPVIATPVGGIPDFLDDRETGIFCSPDNPKSIALAVTLLMNDKNMAVHVAEQAYKRVVENYSWDTIARFMKTEVFDKIRE